MRAGQPLRIAFLAFHLQFGAVPAYVAPDTHEGSFCNGTLDTSEPENDPTFTGTIPHNARSERTAGRCE
jgi:hypothetical protein